MKDLLFKVNLNLYTNEYDSLMVEILDLTIFKNYIERDDYDETYLYELVKEEIYSNIYEYISEENWPTQENPQTGLIILGEFDIKSDQDFLSGEYEEWAELTIKEKEFYKFEDD